MCHSSNSNPFLQSESTVSNIALLLVALALLATFSVGGFGQWTFAPRVYILPVAAVVSTVFLNLAWNEYHRFRYLFLVYFLFVVYQFICFYLHGIELYRILSGTFANHLLAFLGFLSIFPLASVAKYRDRIVAVGASIIGVSLLFALAQWLKADLAWEISALLNERFVRLWAGTSPGLAMHSVSLGYQLLFISPAVICFAIITSGRFVILRWLCVVTFPLPLLAVQSRSVSITFMLVTVAILIITSRRVALFSLDRWRTLAFVLISTLTILATLTQSGMGVVDKLLSPHSLNQTIKCKAIKVECDAKLTENNSGSLRLVAIRAVIDSLVTPTDFIFGPGLESYRQNISSEYKNIYPHNLIFNTLLTGGMVGLVLVCLVYLLILFMACDVKSYFNDRILFLCGLSLMAQIVNSMFHNDSLNHGSIYPWLIAAFILGRSLERSIKRSIPSKIDNCTAQ